MSTKLFLKEIQWLHTKLISSKLQNLCQLNFFFQFKRIKKITLNIVVN
jgi:hypothetical protein